MKKAFILIGAYLLGSFCGAVTGAVISSDAFRIIDVLGFMMMSPLFQFVSLATGFHTKNVVLGLFLIVICVGAMVMSVIWYYRSNSRWSIVTFSIPVFIASLQGAGLLNEAIAA
jgi:hypothetical protein